MAEGNSSSSGGIGFFGLLTIVFITLKLTGDITWSWAWVLAPAWIGLILLLLLFGTLIIGYTVMEYWKKKKGGNDAIR